jgi:hypothetical protein
MVSLYLRVAVQLISPHTSFCLERALASRRATERIDVASIQSL